MNRIWIRGTSGSGKTTLGRALAQRMGIPAVDLDDLYWLPGWESRDREAFRAEVAKVLAQPRWIVMGNYKKAAPTSRRSPTRWCGSTILCRRPSSGFFVAQCGAA